MTYTVAELIEMLLECDQNAKVLMNTDGIHEYIGIFDGCIEQGNFEEEIKMYGKEVHEMYVGVKPTDRKGNYIIINNNM